MNVKVGYIDDDDDDNDEAWIDRQTDCETVRRWERLNESTRVKLGWKRMNCAVGRWTEEESTSFCEVGKGRILTKLVVRGKMIERGSR